jgi:hypothetical protein
MTLLIAFLLLHLIQAPGVAHFGVFLLWVFHLAAHSK